MTSRERGRAVVLAIIAFTFVVEFIAIGTAVPRFGWTHLPRQLIRLAIEVWIAVSLYRGRNWARILVGALCTIAAVAVAIFVAVLHARIAVGPTLLLMALGIAYVIVAVLLLASGSVKSYFAPSGPSSEPTKNARD